MAAAYNEFLRSIQSLILLIQALLLNNKRMRIIGSRVLKTHTTHPSFIFAVVLLQLNRSFSCLKETHLASSFRLDLKEKKQ